MRHVMIIAILIAGTAAAPLLAQDSACVPGGKWAYAGSAKGSVGIRDTGKSTVLEFTPAGKTGPDSVVFSSVNAVDVGTYQVNADVDVTLLSDDAAFQLDGATSAAAGRPFEVVLAGGSGGSSGFSRPINTTGKPFSVQLKGQGTVQIRIRNFVVCRLR